MGDHTQGTPSWVDKALTSTKAIVAFIGGLATFLVGLPNFSEFVPAQYRPYLQGALVVATTIAVWWARNKDQFTPPPAPVAVPAVTTVLPAPLVEPPAQG